MLRLLNLEVLRVVIRFEIGQFFEEAIRAVSVLTLNVHIKDRVERKGVTNCRLSGDFCHFEDFILSVGFRQLRQGLVAVDDVGTDVSVLHHLMGFVPGGPHVLLLVQWLDVRATGIHINRGVSFEHFRSEPIDALEFVGS